MERFFLKVKKTQFFNRFTPFSPNLDFLKKNGSVTFEPIWIPNFIPNFRKIVQAVLEIRCDERTDEWMDGQDWFYRSLGFQPGTNKTNMIKVNSVRRDYWLLGFVYIHFWLILKALHICKQILKKSKNPPNRELSANLWPKLVSYRGEHVFWFLCQKCSKSTGTILKNDFFYLKSAFLCNFEAKYQPNQRNYS